jgi:UDP-glucose 4-epimerase
MNILLTGGAGYIGTHTALTLLESGHLPVLFDNFSNSHKKILINLARISGNNIPWIEGNILDATHLKTTMLDFRIDAVIHFAGLKSISQSVRNPVTYIENNLGGSISLLKVMDQLGIKNLIFSSSASVYGIPKYLPMDESHLTQPTNPYSRSKLHIEEILKDISTNDFGWGIVSLRYFNPVGAHPSGLIGEYPKDTPENLLPYIVKVASGQLPFLKLFGTDYETPDGTGVRDYIHVMDIAEGHLAALNFLANNFKSNAFEVAREVSNKLDLAQSEKVAQQDFPRMHIFNLGTGKGTSVLEMVKTFEKVSGKSIPLKFDLRRVGDVSSCYAGVEHARRYLGWRARRSLNEMCSSAWDFERFMQCNNL